MHRSVDGGRSWTVAGKAGGEPEAVTVYTAGAQTSLFVAVAGRGIVISTDGGRTFAARYAEDRH